MCCVFLVLPPTPIGGIEPLDKTPTATYSLLALNAGGWMVYNIMSSASVFLSLPEDLSHKLVDWFAFSPVSRHPWTYLTYAFTQASLLHLVINLLFLWIFGSHLEDRIGRGRYLLLVLGGAVLACLGQDLYLLQTGVSPTNVPALYGSSAMVLTIMGAYLVYLPGLEFRFLYAYFFWCLRVYASVETVIMPAALYIPVWFLLFGAIDLLGLGASHLSYPALASGFSVGIVAGLANRFLPKTRRKIRKEQETAREKTEKKAAGLYERFLEALSDGAPEAALSLVREGERTKHPLPLTYEDKMRLSQGLLERSEYSVPEKIYRKLLQGELTEERRLDVGLRLAHILLNFERDHEACKNLLRTLYRRYSHHPRVGEIDGYIEQVKEFERNLFKRPQ